MPLIFHHRSNSLRIILGVRGLYYINKLIFKIFELREGFRRVEGSIVEIE
jgi:hypothetical protein